MNIWQKIFGGNDSGRAEKSSRESSSSSSSAAMKGKEFKSEEDEEKPIEVRLASDDEEIFEVVKGGKVVETNREAVEAAKARRVAEDEKKKARGMQKTDDIHPPKTVMSVHFSLRDQTFL